jgi:hypothetical protein
MLYQDDLLGMIRSHNTVGVVARAMYLNQAATGSGPIESFIVSIARSNVVMVSPR